MSRRQTQIGFQLTWYLTNPKFVPHRRHATSPQAFPSTSSGQRQHKPCSATIAGDLHQRCVLRQEPIFIFPDVLVPSPAQPSPAFLSFLSTGGSVAWRAGPLFESRVPSFFCWRFSSCTPCAWIAVGSVAFLWRVAAGRISPEWHREGTRLLGFSGPLTFSLCHCPHCIHGAFPELWDGRPLFLLILESSWAWGACTLWLGVLGLGSVRFAPEEGGPVVWGRKGLVCT